MPEVKHGFILFGKMSVTYSGRASSTLEPGYYLLIRKPDGSTAIHGGELIPALNYQQAGSKMYQEGKQLTVKSDTETMVIDILEILNCYKPTQWSTNKIKLNKTEKQLRDWLADNIKNYLPNIINTIKEAPTAHGPVDLIAIDSQDTNHIFEIKRTTINLSAITQVRKYMETFDNPVGYVAAPSIFKNAQLYADRHKITYIKLNFDMINQSPHQLSSPQ